MRPYRSKQCLLSSIKLKASCFSLCFFCFVDKELYLLSVQCDGSYIYALFSNSLMLKIGTGYNSTVQGHIYKERIIVDIEGCSRTEDDIPKQLFWFNVRKKLSKSRK